MLREPLRRARLRQSGVLGAAARQSDIPRVRAGRAERVGATAPYLQTVRQLRDEIDRARSEGIVEACLAAEVRSGLPHGLLLAIASRETHCRNIVGDSGHGRGVFQIDDRFHGGWLRAHGAGAPGAVPSVEDGAAYAAELLAANLAFGRRKGLKGARLLRFAAAAYNAGAGGAWRGLEESGDPDARTAHGNYGADVLERRRLIRAWLREPWPTGARFPEKDEHLP